MTKQKDEFAGIEDVKHAGSDEKWVYSSIGFSTANGNIFINDETPESITGQIIAVRECKEVNTGTQALPSWTRYHTYTKRSEMVTGVKVQPRVQVLINIDGQIYNFGCKSWTSRALFTNAIDGKFHDEKYQAGLLPSLKEQIAKVKADKGVTTGLGSWTVTISKAKKTVTNEHTGNDMYALAWKIDGFVGKDLHVSNDDLIESEELAEWVREWSTAGGSVVEDEVFESSESDIDAVMSAVGSDFDL